MKNLLFVLFPLKITGSGRNDPPTNFDFWRDTMTPVKVVPSQFFTPK